MVEKLSWVGTVVAMQKTIVAGVALAALLAALGYIYATTPAGTGYADVRIAIDFGNGTVAEKGAVAVAGTTAFELIAKNFDVKYESYSIGKMITCINGVCGDKAKNEYWFFYINGQLASVGTDGYRVKDKDAILMNYTLSVFG